MVKNEEGPNWGLFVLVNKRINELFSQQPNLINITGT